MFTMPPDKASPFVCAAIGDSMVMLSACIPTMWQPGFKCQTPKMEALASPWKWTGLTYSEWRHGSCLGDGLSGLLVSLFLIVDVPCHGVHEAVKDVPENRGVTGQGLPAILNMPVGFSLQNNTL